MDYKVLGKNIQKERIKHQMTQKQLAEHVHVSPSYIGQIERGERNVSLEILVQIANSLNNPIDSFLRYNYNKNLQRKVLYREITKQLQSYSNKELQLLLHLVREISAYISNNTSTGTSY